MSDLRKYLSACLLGIAALLVGASPAFAAGAPSLGTASGFAVLSAAPGSGGAVTCTDSIITGDVGSSGPPTSVIQSRCTIAGAIIAPVSAQVLADFKGAYDAFAAVACDGNLTGSTLTFVKLAPGVYCFDAAATLTGEVTLAGPSDGIWIFKIAGTLTGTNFRVFMTNGALACNVYWWVAQAATMTDSDFKGTILAGAATTITGGHLRGRALAKAAVMLTGVAATRCGGDILNSPKQRCKQGVGNGPERCDPGNSNQGTPFPFSSKDEFGGVPGNPGRKGGNN